MLKSIGFLALGCLVVHADSAAVSVSSNRVAEIAKWLPARAQAYGKPISDRESWDRLAKSANASTVIDRAEELAKTPIPKLTDELYLDYSKTGNRTRCQEIMAARDPRIAAFVLAECLEDKGRFLPPMEEIAREICAERSWLLPAHDGDLKIFNGQAFQPDLRATLVAWDLATSDYLLGNRLKAETRQMIRENVRQRVLAPFKLAVTGQGDPLHWLRVANNWNAVCLAGVTGAALAIEDSPAERAFVIAATEKSITHFLAGFTPDGYCSEGVGYWNYGFGRFLMLAEMMRQHTGGKIDLLALSQARGPALFPFRSEILAGVYPCLADCSPSARPGKELLQYIGLRFGSEDAIERPDAFGSRDRGLGPVLMNAFLPNLPRIPGDPIPNSLPPRTWFQEGGVLICRPGSSRSPLSAVIKGGHNAEQHNHNDLGSFSVLFNKTVLICDPGAEEYTRRTFSPQRYDSKVLNSYGHSVPVIAGKLQRPGRQAQAVVKETSFHELSDRIRFDLRSAYNVPELKRLERSFEYQRGTQPKLVVEDTVTFAGKQTFETALVTWSPWRQAGAGELLIGTGKEILVVRIESAGKPVAISSETINEHVHTPVKPVRIRFAVEEPVESTVFRVTITPKQNR